MARPAAKKAQIEDAAVYLFATKGVAETTIKDIAARAKVAEGALYRHYRGKNEMAWELFSRELVRFSSSFEGVLFAEARSFRQRLREAVRFIYEYYRDHSVEFSFVLLTQHGFPEKKLRDERHNPNDMAIRFVKEAMAAGEARGGDGVLLAALLMGAVLQPVVMHRYGRLKRHPRTMAKEVAAACEALLGAKAKRG